MTFNLSVSHLAEHNRQCGESLQLSEDHLNLLYGIMGLSTETLEALPLAQLIDPPIKRSEVRRATLQSLLNLLHTVPAEQQSTATRLVFLAYHHLMLDVLGFIRLTAVETPKFRALNRAAYSLRDLHDTEAAHAAFAAHAVPEGCDLLLGAQHTRQLHDLAVSLLRCFEQMAKATTYVDRAAALSRLYSVAAVLEVFRLYRMAGAQLKLRSDQVLTVEEVINRADDFGLPRLARFFDLALADLAEETP